MCALATRERGRPAETVSVRRERLRAERSHAAYQQLRAAAQAVDCWETGRERALEALREDAGRGPV